MSRCSPLALVCLVLWSLSMTMAAYCQDQPPEKPTGVMTIDDLFAQVVSRVPAFGGMFVDEKSDTLYLYMVPGEGGDLARLDRVITDVLGPNRPPEHKLQALAAQYTFRQLKTWHDRLSPQVLALPGAVFTDIDDSKNRLEVGIETWALAGAVETVLAALDIPREVVNLEETPPVSLPGIPADQNPLQTVDEVREGKTLRDEFRPLVGGLQIQIAVTGLASSSTCTLGFLATREKILGLVTNDHCIQEHNQRHLDLNMFYQPTIDDKYKVGNGSVDPDYFKKEQNPDCPENRFCRFSDSAFATLTDKATDPVGYVAKPASGLDWDGTTKFRIVGTVKPVKDMSVTRVSSQSGIDTGSVSNPCRNLNTKDSKGRDTGVTLLCQVSVGWTVKVVPGDSGSPVFTTNKENNDVMLLGLLWGDTGVSPVDQIKITGTELGPTLLVCADGLKC